MPRIPNAQRMGWDSFKNDMFGRAKVSVAKTLFDSSHRYSLAGQHDPVVTGGGTYALDANASLVDLNVGTASGDKVDVESFRVMPYQPGKALQVMQSFTMALAKTNLRQRVGYFSRHNGIYFEQHHNKYYIVKRSYSTGTLVEERVEQKDWNVEPFLGMGPTDIVLDFSKSQIMWMELEWLGVGSVRVGFVHNGVFLVAHQFNWANYETGTYMTTASLPVRYEIENTGITASSSTFKQICASVISNGDYDKRPPRELAVRATPVSVNSTWAPLVAIRMAAGRTDSVVLPGPLSVVPTASADYEYKLLKNPTVSGGTWATYGRGNIEYNISPTSFTGGTTLRHDFVTSTNQSTSAGELENLDRFDLQMGRSNAETPVSDIYLLAARTISGNGSVLASMSWYNLI